MKHHFADLLDRTVDYWTIIPNIERYSFSADKDIKNKNDVKVLTISKQDKHWNQVFDCPSIEEITLNDPSKEQVEEIQKLGQIKRLRLSFFRAKDIEFIANLENLEEVVFEYVSGFSDLSPFQKLTKIKSLHFENLRRVSNFEGLKGISSLRYLHIDGTLDWSQPIDNFNFLEGLENLEVLALGFIVNKTDYPALLPILKLKNFKRFKAGMSTLSTREFAFLEVAISDKERCNFSNTKLEKYYINKDKSVYFLGKEQELLT
ncbi:MAG: leucine-rich repeat domain-containing protein [Sphingobacteriales bacterium]|nr:leucine-rich repeat domain-containing protein [Sphingobacteriales bacterium]